jgi:Tetratricopeptide repeat
VIRALERDVAHPLDAVGLAQHSAHLPVPAPVGGTIGEPASRTPDLIQKGIAALNTRDFGTALVLFRQARQLQPGNPDLGYLMGVALESTGEPGAAIDAFRSCQSGPYA